jgi:hypothetical protein
MPDADTERIRRETEEFSAMVTVVGELMRAGKIMAKVMPPESVELHFEMGQLRPILTLKGIDEKSFEGNVDSIGSLMTGLFMVGSCEAVVSTIIEAIKEEIKDAPQRAKFNEETERRILDAKARMVESQLMTPEIKNDFLAKATSKTNYFSKLRWEVNQKRFDESGEFNQQVVFATLRLELRKTVGDHRGPPYSAFKTADSESIVFDVGLQDARELHGALVKIVGMMESALKAKESSSC